MFSDATLGAIAGNDALMFALVVVIDVSSLCSSPNTSNCGEFGPSKTCFASINFCSVGNSTKDKLDVVKEDEDEDDGDIVPLSCFCCASTFCSIFVVHTATISFCKLANSSSKGFHGSFS